MYEKSAPEELFFTSLRPVTESAAENPILEVRRMTMVAGIKGRPMIFSCEKKQGPML
jgi:hypothetical protein